VDLPEPIVRHAGSRNMPHPPNLVRSLKALQRSVADLTWLVKSSPLQPVLASVAAGQPCTAGSMTAVYRMWTYRDGAAVYADVAVGCGSASVVQVRLACPDLSVTGTTAVSGAGGEQVLRVQLDLPDEWTPGDTHFVTVQAFRSSGSDATTMQVVRGWQK
jgi:hypothetical protein